MQASVNIIVCNGFIHELLHLWFNHMIACTHGVRLPWISRSVCTIRRPCWRTAWRQWKRSIQLYTEKHITPCFKLALTFISFSDGALKYQVLDPDLIPRILKDHFLSSDTSSSLITLNNNNNNNNKTVKLLYLFVFINKSIFLIE